MLLIVPVLAEDASYWVSASVSFGNMGKWSEALDATEKAIVIEPNNKVAWNNKAWALLHLSRYNDALNAAEKAISIDSNYESAWVNKGSALGAVKRFNEELEASNKAISLNPNSIGAYVNKGQALAGLGRVQESLNATEKAIEVNPSNSESWNNKAAALISLKRYEEAINSTEQAIALNPKNVRAWVNKGNALKSLGRYQEALVAYDEALAIDPNYESAKNYRQFIISNNLTNSTNQSVSSPSITPSAHIPQPTAVTPSGSQDNQPLFLPLMFIILLVVIGLGAFGYNTYKQKLKTPVSSSPETTSIIPSINSHHDVFISYAQNDKPIADATCAKLESNSIRCWISPRDMPPGENFPKAIMDGIEGSKIMVLIFSSHSNNSQHVIREITSAVNKGLIIIPLRIENILPSREMEYLISTPHWLDAITPPLEEHLNTLATRIEKILSTYTPEFKEEKR